MHDLLYNDLGTVDGTEGLDLSGGLDGSVSANGAWVGGDGNGNVGNGGVGGGVGQWQFEGDFGNDSFWGFMNSYNP